MSSKLPLQSTEAPSIASIAIPSRDRPDILRRGLVSYIQNCKRYGRTNNFVVVDGSIDSTTRSAYREMLAALGTCYGVEIRYADIESKRRFARRLVEHGSIPKEVVDFALFNVERCDLTTAGANRNALLLDTIDDVILSVDDDTVCEIVAAPGLEDRLTIRCGLSSGFETWFYPDRETLLRSVAFVDKDLLALHEQVLGSSLGRCIAALSSPADLQMTGAEDRSVQQLDSGSGHVAVSLNGIVGDCGSSRPFSLFLPKHSFNRLTCARSEYYALRLSREVLRFVPNITITDRYESMMAGFFGLDNRALVPPFLPLGRGQDGLFGRVLRTCFGNAYAARLPWSLLHAPPEARSFTPHDLTKRAGAGGLASLIGRLVASLEDGGPSDGAERLRNLGGYLEKIARLPEREFAEVSRSSLWNTKLTHIFKIEARLSRFNTSLPWWAEDVARYLDAHYRTLAQPESWVPDDLLRRYDFGEAQAWSQRLVLQFGRLLAWWPAIVETARDLRRRGYRLSESV